MIIRGLSTFTLTRGPASPAERRGTQLFWGSLLTAASLSASLVFACATPFAAFAVLAAAMLPVRTALVTIAAVWAVNQAIGFALLGYPRALDTAMWGFAIGAAALIATLIAATVLRRLARAPGIVAYAIALAASFAGYELCLWAVTPILGGTEAFTADIVGWLAFLNAVWLAGLAGAWEVARLIEPKIRRYALRHAAP